MPFINIKITCRTADPQCHIRSCSLHTSCYCLGKVLALDGVLVCPQLDLHQDQSQANIDELLIMLPLRCMMMHPPARYFVRTRRLHMPASQIPCLERRPTQSTGQHSSRQATAESVHVPLTSQTEHWRVQSQHVGILGLTYTSCCRMSSAQGIMLGQTRPGSFQTLQLSTCHCMPACWSRTALCSQPPVLQLQPWARACLLAMCSTKVRLSLSDCSRWLFPQILTVRPVIA